MRGLDSAKAKRGLIIFAVILLGLALLPLLSRHRYLLHVLIVIFVYVTLVESWNLPGGYAGYTSFGHVLFFGVGGYCTATLVTYYHLPSVITYLLGGCLSALVALIFGYISLRLRGPYFAIATLALATIGRYIFLNIDYFGGAEGLLLPLSPWPLEFEKVPYYYASLLVAALSVSAVYLITQTRFGLGLLAIRENEEKAEGAGVDTTKHKVIAFMISAFFPGVIGGVFASYLEYVNPDSCFSILYSANILLMAILGGLGTISGPILGASIIVILSEVLSFTLGHQVRLVLFGVVLTVLAIYLPGGLLSLKERLGGGKMRESVFQEEERRRLSASSVSDA